MQSDVQVDVKGQLASRMQLQLLAMPYAKRQRLLRKVARKVERQARKRIKEQHDLDGKPFPEHARKRARKMLARIIGNRYMTIYATGTEAKLGFRGFAGNIAYMQQFGAKVHVRASDFATGVTDRTAPATLRQARELLKAGFMIKRKNGKGKRKPTARYITEHLTMGAAGMILRQLRGPAKQEWTTTLPERSFLGATPQEITDYTKDIFDEILSGEANNGTR